MSSITTDFKSNRLVNNSYKQFTRISNCGESTAIGGTCIKVLVALGWIVKMDGRGFACQSRYRTTTSKDGVHVTMRKKVSTFQTTLSDPSDAGKEGNKPWLNRFPSFFV